MSEKQEEIVHHLSMVSTYAGIINEHLVQAISSGANKEDLNRPLELLLAAIDDIDKAVKNEQERREGYWEQVVKFWTGPYY